MLQVIPCGAPVPMEKIAEASFIIPKVKIVKWTKEVEAFAALDVYYERMKRETRPHYEDENGSGYAEGGEK